MTIIGFTGTRVLPSPDEERKVVATLYMLHGTEYVTGGAIGVDALVGAELAKLYPLASHRIIVPADRSRVDPWWRMKSPPHLSVQPMPEGSTYRDRNRAIVDRADELMAYPLYGEHDERSKRSGTWQTIRLARAAGKPVSVTILSGLEQVWVRSRAT